MDMVKLIEVESSKGSPVFINADLITSIVQANPSATTCEVWFASGNSIPVKSTARAVVDKIKNLR